jgi:acetate kinase
MTDAVLTINAGSSSLKFSLYRVGDDGEPAAALEGEIEDIGGAPHMSAKDAGGKMLVDRRWQDSGMDHAALLEVLVDWLREQQGDMRLVAVGHRVVHGGTEFTAPARIDDAVLAKLDGLCPLAPLHQPHNLAGIRAVAAAQPDLPQVACFDTAFHRAHPELADWFALPRRFHDDGIRRYGFHGLSYEYIARTLPATAPELKDARVVAAHLGSGASMCAMQAGRSIDSTMAFTALDGLPMGTRCGALDPGVVLHLIRAYGMDADAIEAMLYHESGLKGVSGISNDMRDLLASDDPRAAQAVDLFVWHIARELGALSAVLGGLDALVFTAGIGERSPEIR